MAHTGRQRPLTGWKAALLLCTLLARGQGRPLAEDALVDASGVTSGAAESSVEGNIFKSTPVLVSSSISVSPFSWFQQQLSIFEAVEQALFQRMNEGLVAPEASSTSTQADLLRHVGCARMRAALLNKAAQQEVMAGRSASAHAGSVSAVAGSLSDMDGGEEYIEDYTSGTVSSRAAYTSSDARLRGIAASAATDSGDSDADAAASVMESRRLSTESYYGDYYDFYGSGYDGDFDPQRFDDSYGFGYEGEGVYSGLYSGAYEYEYDDVMEYDVEEEDDDESSDASKARNQGTAKQHGVLSMLGNKEVLEGRVLQLLEGAYTLAAGSKDATTTSQGMVVVDAASTASASAVEAGESVTAKAAVAATDAAASESAAAFGYDSYDLLDLADMTAGLGSLDGGGVYFGYEYDLYEDYYQAMNLADLMLSKLNLDNHDDEWADYLEQTYEYFAFYMDGDDDYPSYTSAAASVDGTSAIEALASIAELVVWAHMGSFLLEVRPAFTISQLSPVDGPVLAETGSVLLISSEPEFSGFSLGAGDAASYAAAVLTLGDLQLQQQVAGAAPLEIVNDISLRWVYPDGSLNWGLVMLCVLAAGTAAMLVGCVASWLALRRSMLAASRGWVYVPQGAGKRCGKGGASKGFEDFGYDAPLMLRPEDCKGAVCWGATAAASVEDASEYVSPKLANESVARALYK